MSGKVWKLTPQKAAFLEDQFKQKGGVLVRSDGKFYGIHEWQEIDRSIEIGQIKKASRRSRV